MLALHGLVSAIDQQALAAAILLRARGHNNPGSNSQWEFWSALHACVHRYRKLHYMVGQLEQQERMIGDARPTAAELFVGEGEDPGTDAE
jgi:hypothetical protein